MGASAASTLRCCVRIVDPQQKLPAVPTRKQPGEQSGAHSADVQVTCRTRSEAGANHAFRSNCENVSAGRLADVPHRATSNPVPAGQECSNCFDFGFVLEGANYDPNPKGASALKKKDGVRGALSLSRNYSNIEFLDLPRTGGVRFQRGQE